MPKNCRQTYSSGFTLIELLLVVAILSILVTAIFVAVNVPQRLQDTNDSRRSLDASNIASAIQQYVIDTKGDIPAGVTTTEQQLGTSVTGCVNLNRGCNVVAGACLDLSTILKDYLSSIPKDPKIGSNSKTGYTIYLTGQKGVVVKACGAEGLEDITVTR